MARIVGVDLPSNKRGEIALTYIYGIGRSLAETICNDRNRGIESVSSDSCEFSIPMSCQHNFSLDDDMNEFVGENFVYSLAA